MNEIVIMMAAIVIVGILPVIAVAFLAMRALSKSFERLENQLDNRTEKIKEGIERTKGAVKRASKPN